MPAKNPAKKTQKQTQDIEEKDEIEEKVTRLTPPQRKVIVKRRSPLSTAVYVITWLTSILVSLAVGFGMVSGTLRVPYLQPLIPIAGWIVIILTLANVLLGFINALTKI